MYSILRIVGWGLGGLQNGKMGGWDVGGTEDRGLVSRQGGGGGSGGWKEGRTGRDNGRKWGWEDRRMGGWESVRIGEREIGVREYKNKGE